MTDIVAKHLMEKDNQSDRVSEIEKQLCTQDYYVRDCHYRTDDSAWGVTYEQVRWLLAEVERLRAVLAEFATGAVAPVDVCRTAQAALDSKKADYGDQPVDDVTFRPGAVTRLDSKKG